MPQFRTCSMNFFGEKGGQLQFTCAPPRYRAPENDIIWPDKSGAVFIEGAPPDPNNPGFLDWKNGKIVFALADKDIGDLLAAIANQADGKVIHTTNDDKDVKTFRISAPKPFNGKNTYNLSLQMKSNGAERSISLFINEGDLIRLRVYLAASLPYILGLHNL